MSEGDYKRIAILGIGTKRGNLLTLANKKRRSLIKI